MSSERFRQSSLSYVSKITSRATTQASVAG